MCIYRQGPAGLEDGGGGFERIPGPHLAMVMTGMQHRVYRLGMKVTTAPSWEEYRASLALNIKAEYYIRSSS